MPTTTLQWIVAGLWALSVFFDYNYFTYHIQLKEYRLDKTRDFLSSKAGKEFLMGYRIFVRAVLVAILYSLIGHVVNPLYIVAGIFVLDILHNGYHVYKKDARRPRYTAKSLIIMCTAIAIECTAILFIFESYIFLLLLVFRFAIVTFAAVIWDIPSMLIKKMYIFLAKRKIAKYKDMKVIGITGSYGKTTTKEFLSHILDTKFNIIKTPKHINTEIGIAMFVLKADFKDKDLFIVEMGAYRKGEIALICNMVKPEIGILTAISPQHLTLFGSMENIQKAKYELLRSLPTHGLAITNSDNKYCREFLHELDAEVMTFGTEKEFNPTCLLTDIKETKEGIIGSGTTFGQAGDIFAPIHGAYNAMNIAPCYLVARHLDMGRQETKDAIATLPNVTPIRLYKYGKALILDDSYNSNPDGFRAALDFLGQKGKGKERIVITRGMLELGERSDELHEEIAGDISFLADKVVLISKDFVEPIRRGLVHKFGIELSVITDRLELLSYVQSLKDKDVAILLENRIPSVVFKEIKEHKTSI